MTDGQFDNADVFGVAGVAFDGSAAGILSSSSESEMVMTSCGRLLLLVEGALSQEPGRWPGYLSATI